MAARHSLLKDRREIVELMEFGIHNEMIERNELGTEKKHDNNATEFGIRHSFQVKQRD
jgi:hypothetical protein